MFKNQRILVYLKPLFVVARAKKKVLILPICVHQTAKAKAVAVRELAAAAEVVAAVMAVVAVAETIVAVEAAVVAAAKAAVAAVVAAAVAAVVWAEAEREAEVEV